MLLEEFDQDTDKHVLVLINPDNLEIARQATIKLDPRCGRLGGFAPVVVLQFCSGSIIMVRDNGGNVFDMIQLAMEKR